MRRTTAKHRRARQAQIGVAALCLALLTPSYPAGQTLQHAAPAVAEHHVGVDPLVYPWSSVAKLFNSIGGACTGAVVARDKVLTAAHCLYAYRTHRFLPPDAIHVLLGYQRGDYRIHARVIGFVTGPGYDPVREAATLAADWAVLRVAEPFPPDVRALSLSDAVPANRAKLMLGGFAQDRAYAMTADTRCELVATQGPLLLHDCAAMPGDSGAPLLGGDAEHGFEMVGIHVARSRIGDPPAGVAVSTTRAAFEQALH